MRVTRHFFIFFFFLMIRRPPGSTQGRSSAASDGYKRQFHDRAEESLVTCRGAAVTYRGGRHMPDWSAPRAPQNPKGHPKSIPRACLTASQEPSLAALAGFKFHIENAILLVQYAQPLRVCFAIPPSRCCKVLQIWAESGIVHRM